jgi:hypothetical protein
MKFQTNDFSYTFKVLSDTDSVKLSNDMTNMMRNYENPWLPLSGVSTAFVPEKGLVYSQTMYKVDEVYVGGKKHTKKMHKNKTYKKK